MKKRPSPEQNSSEGELQKVKVVGSKTEALAIVTREGRPVLYRPETYSGDDFEAAIQKGLAETKRLMEVAIQDLEDEDLDF